MTYQLAPSLLAADAARLADEAGAVRRGGAAMLHLDIMDGHFAPNLSFGPHIAACLSRVAALPLDVHLMVERPSMFVGPFCDAGASIINVHAEAEDEKTLLSILAELRQRGVRPAVTLRPATPLDALTPFLDHVDMVLVMTVEPGYGGQSFLPGSLERIAAVRTMLGRRPKPINLQIDGGVTLANARSCLEAGANILVAGSAVFGAPDVEARTREFVSLLEECKG